MPAALSDSSIPGYHKIENVFLRDDKTHVLIPEAWRTPEFQYLKDCRWQGTEKVDGTNVRVTWDGTTVSIAGRGAQSELDQFHGLVPAVTALFEPSKLALSLPATAERPVTFFGEGYGAKINSGGNYRSDQSFVLFDIWWGIWLERHNVQDIAQKLKLDTVPMPFAGTLQECVDRVGDGIYSNWNPTVLAEGLVCRPATELRTRTGHRVICKIKTKDIRAMRGAA